MDIVDDAQLMKLAAHRPHPLLPVLNRTQSFKPLILLLAVLPGLIVVQSQPVDDVTSQWGLRAIDAFAAESVDDVVAPGQVQTAAGLRFQPPLGTWLTVGAMHLLGPDHPLSATIVSYAAAIGVFAMTYVLMSRLAGGRVGFWTIILLAGHPSGLELYRAPPAVPLTLLFALVAWWGIVRHRDESESPASVSLLLAGIATGLGILSGGTTIIPVVGVLIVTLGYDAVRAQSSAPTGSGHRRRKKRLTRSTVPVLAVVLTAFAVAGWWFLMLSARFGTEFWTGWFAPGSADSLSDSHHRTGLGVIEILASFGSLLGMLGVVSIAGFVRAMGFHKPAVAVDDAQPRRITLVVVWTITASLFYAAGLGTAPIADWRITFSQGFLLIPLLACAATLLDDVMLRRIGLNGVALVTFGSLAGFVALRMWAGAGSWNTAQYVRVGGALVAAITAGVLICGYGSRTEGRRRIAIGGFVGVLLICNLATAVGKPYAGNRREERELKAFMKGIPDAIPVDRCLIVAGARTPTRLEFAVRSRWPLAEFSIVSTWNSAFRDVPPGPSRERRTFVVEWMTAQEHPTKIDLPGFKVTPIGKSRYYQHRDLRAFHIRAEAAAPAPKPQ